MSAQYEGTIEDVKALVEQGGVIGEWAPVDASGKYCFRSQRGGVLNFWPSRGTVQCQGKAGPKAELEALFSGVVPVNLPAASSRSSAAERTKIFVVHGHDQVALEQLELVLRRLHLDPYILQNNDGQSRTLIEALEQQIYKEAAFGIVLLTPDDYGYPKSKTDADRQPRTRQNVILELGMVLASLGRDRMVLLKKGALEIPTDVNGVIYLEFNEHVKEVAVKLATRMKGAGIPIDDSLIHSAAV